MDQDNQSKIKEIVETEKSGNDSKDIIVVLGSGDIEGALISADTVTVGDPSFSGPLTGISLRLPVYHILEPLLKEFIPGDIYEKNLGIWMLTIDTEKIGEEFQKIREKTTN